MKNILGISLLLLLSILTVKAQSNLQFNKVVLVQMSYVLPNTNSFQTSQQSITVPAGKIWKIESASGSAQGPSTNYISPTTTITLNGMNLTFYNSSSGTYWQADFPIWLPEGTYTLGLVSSSSVLANTTITGRISGIEFNVLP